MNKNNNTKELFNDIADGLFAYGDHELKLCYDFNDYDKREEFHNGLVNKLAKIISRHCPDFDKEKFIYDSTDIDIFGETLTGPGGPTFSDTETFNSRREKELWIKEWFEEYHRLFNPEKG